MNIKEIKLAAAMAARFIALSKEVPTRTVEGSLGDKHEYLESGATSGALRRASMDLTRQLAVMRRPG